MIFVSSRYVGQARIPVSLLDEGQINGGHALHFVGQLQTQCRAPSRLS